jgi:hypothetical protein
MRPQLSLISIVKAFLSLSDEAGLFKVLISVLRSFPDLTLASGSRCRDG